MKPMEACSYVWQNCNLVVRPPVSAPALRVSSSPTCRKSLCFLTPVSIVDIRVQSVFVSRLGLSEAGWHDIYRVYSSVVSTATICCKTCVALHCAAGTCPL